ncbi:hypothetical protein PCH70_38640 [Pseudomonas cichorii JBC1]|nr:hypothetical protein PCH70_38640 [Pseudomonas cichorii JBC1]
MDAHGAENNGMKQRIYGFSSAWTASANSGFSVRLNTRAADV